MRCIPYILVICLLGSLQAQFAYGTSVQNSSKRSPINTLSQPAKVIFRKKQGQELEVTLSSILRVTAVVGDPAGVEGILSLSLSDSDREKLSKSFAIKVKNVPSQITIKSVRADVQRESKCPGVKILVPSLETSILDGSVSLKNQTMVLDTDNAQMDIGKNICRWTSQIDNGFGHAHRLLRPINEQIWMIENGKKIKK